MQAMKIKNGAQADSWDAWLSNHSTVESGFEPAVAKVELVVGCPWMDAFTGLKLSQMQ